MSDVDASRNVVVVGASAGGLEALRRIVAELPSNFAAPIVVVVHYPRDAPSMLPTILARSGPLATYRLEDGMPLRPGAIGIGPPGLHVTLAGDAVRLHRGPRENAQRPSIDVLFRSAAHAYGPRTIGIVLSGMLDDGTAGLRDVIAYGGRAIVQDPDDAEFPQMPASAVRNNRVDYVWDAASIGRRLSEVLGAERGRVVSPVRADRSADLVPIRFSCPECGGSLREYDRDLPAFRCRVGHAYTIESLLDAAERAREASLWSAIRSAEERCELIDRLIAGARGHGDDAAALGYRRMREDADASVRRLRATLGAATDGA